MGVFVKYKDKALELRLQNKSYLEISKALGIPKSTLSNWFSKSEWSNEIKTKLIQVAKEKHVIRMKAMGVARRAVLQDYYDKARAEAAKELLRNKFDPAFMFCIALYYGEGDKVTTHQLRVTNTDPELMRIFKIFLNKYMNVKDEKIWAQLILYKDLNSDECIEYWSKKIALDKARFTKSSFIVGRHKKNKLKYGICIVGVSSRFLKEKMLQWLRLVPNCF